MPSPKQILNLFIQQAEDKREERERRTFTGRWLQDLKTIDGDGRMARVSSLSTELLQERIQILSWNEEKSLGKKVKRKAGYGTGHPAVGLRSVN